MSYGALRYGVFTYGGHQLHDLPSVTVTAPTGTLTTGGPNLTVQWTYSQPQGDPQIAFRIVITNPAETSVFYDTGFLGGSNTSYTFNAIENGVPAGDSVSLRVRVYVRSSQGFGYESSDTEDFVIDWGTPACVITYPLDNSQITVSAITVTWVYGDTDAKPQSAFRVKLKAVGSDYLFYDSNWVAGAATSFALPYTLRDDTHYKLELFVKNSEGVISDQSVVSFWVELGDELSAPDVKEVGQIYEVGINGVGYMLYDGHDIADELRRERVVIPLEPPRLATTETPFAEAIERYTFFAGSDFRGGAGQRFADRPSTDPASYWDSVGLNPFERGEIRLLKQIREQMTTLSSKCEAAVADERIFINHQNSSLRYMSDPEGTVTTLSITKDGTNGVVIRSLTSDHQRWYVGCGNDGILRGTTTDPASVWSTVPAHLVRWAAQRICAAYIGGGSTTPNVFTTLTGTGAEEVSGGRISLPPGWTISEITAGGGFLWFSAFVRGRGVVYKWDLTNATPSVAWELPIGQEATSVFWYQGEVFVRAGVRENATGTVSSAIIYRCQVDDGNLVPTFVVRLRHPSRALAEGGFGADDRFVFFSWGYGFGGEESDDYSGIGAIDLSTGGYCRWIGRHQNSGHGTHRTILTWRNRLWYTEDTWGLYSEHATNVRPSGRLRTSIHDGASNTEKVVDHVALRFLPLPTGTSISLKRTFDGGNSYATVPISAGTAGQTETSAVLNKKAASVGLEITLHGSAALSPTLTMWQVQVHPLGKADVVLRLPIDCSDRVAGLNGANLPDSGDGAGGRRARELENLVQQRVKVQDVDWKDTGITEIFELVEVRRVLLPGVVRDPRAGKARAKEIAVCTFRRNLR